MSKKSLAYRAKRKLLKMIRGDDPAKKQKPEIKHRILLLTNRDSDNVGDQVIEATDKSLISAAMKNLGYAPGTFKINSHAAAIIPRAYVKGDNRDPKLLEKAHHFIGGNDLVFFGGAPLFNYLYQIFYERTAMTIEIAREYGKPVVFSAIGVESYHEDNPKCQRLKAALNLDNVKRITTRDGIEHLEKYKERPDLFIDKVSDPAVFAGDVFRKYLKKDEENSGKYITADDEFAKNGENAESSARKKKIGIFIIRANAFEDNKIDFSWRDAAVLWCDLVRKLEEKGYDYEVLTSGHFGDEAFLDKLITVYHMPAKKCAFNINNPEILMTHMADYDAVISCRLHPSIIAFSMDMPSVSLVWNPKVRGFYENIGYTERLIEHGDFNADRIIEVLEKAMEEGVRKDKEYLMSVYRNIYYGLRDSLQIDDTGRTVYTYDELIENLPDYSGTSERENLLKLKRKFRRTYRTYNEAFDKVEALKAEVRELKEQLESMNP